MLYASLLGLSFLGLLQLVFGGDMLMTMRISLGLVVFCGYLVYNTQMMMGGKKNGRQIRPNEHIMDGAQSCMYVFPPIQTGSEPCGHVIGPPLRRL